MNGQMASHASHLAGAEHGLPLPALFAAVLDALQDHDGRTVADLVGLVATAMPKRERLAELYGPADPFGDVVRDALDCLERQGIAARDGQGAWRTGEKFATGRPLRVVPGRKVTVIVYAAEERDRRNLAEKRRMAVQGLAARLRPDGPGLRPLNEGHVESLAKSMREWGWLEHSTVVEDQHGRILAGRHRLEAAKRAGVDPPESRRVTTGSDDESLGYALDSNLLRGWSAKERAGLDDELRVGGLTTETVAENLSNAAKRRLVEERLREDPARSDVLIAEGVTTDKTVAEVRADLEATSEIPRVQTTVGRDGKWRTYKRKNQDEKRKNRDEKREPGTPTFKQRVQDFLSDGGSGSTAEIAAATDVIAKTVSSILSGEKDAGRAEKEGGRWRRVEPTPAPTPDVEREVRSPAPPEISGTESGDPTSTTDDPASMAIPEERRRKVIELYEEFCKLPTEDRAMLRSMLMMSED